MKTIPWTDKEVTILKENYGKIHISELPKLLPGRTIPSIKSRVRFYGLKISQDIIRNKRKNFSIEEKNIINEFYGKISNEELCKLLPNRGIYSIYNYAFKNKIKGNRYLNSNIYK